MDKYFFEICRAGVVFETTEGYQGIPVYNHRIFGTSYIGPNTAPPDGYLYLEHRGDAVVANATPADYAALDAAMELHRQIPNSIYVRHRQGSVPMVSRSSRDHS